MKKIKFSCDNHRAVILDEETHAAADAAEHFARLKAASKYGKKGAVGALRIDGYALGSFEVDAFIGEWRERNVCGGNVRFVVHHEKQK